MNSLVIVGNMSPKITNCQILHMFVRAVKSVNKHETAKATVINK